MINMDKAKAAMRMNSLKNYYKSRGYKIFSPFADRLDFIATSKIAAVSGSYDKAIVTVNNHQINQVLVFDWRR